jgi:H+/Cl- antiporter ClcA
MAEGNDGMTNKQLMLLVLAASAVCVVIGVYYLIPGIYHPLTFDSPPNDSHLKHALLFFGLAVLGVIASRFVVNRNAPKKS